MACPADFIDASDMLHACGEIWRDNYELSNRKAKIRGLM